MLRKITPLQQLGSPLNLCCLVVAIVGLLSGVSYGMHSSPTATSTSSASAVVGSNWYASTDSTSSQDDSNSNSTTVTLLATLVPISAVSLCTLFFCLLCGACCFASLSWYIFHLKSLLEKQRALLRHYSNCLSCLAQMRLDAFPLKALETKFSLGSTNPNATSNNCPHHGGTNNHNKKNRVSSQIAWFGSSSVTDDAHAHSFPSNSNTIDPNLSCIPLEANIYSVCSLLRRIRPYIPDHLLQLDDDDALKAGDQDSTTHEEPLLTPRSAMNAASTQKSIHPPVVEQQLSPRSPRYRVTTSIATPSTNKSQNKSWKIIFTNPFRSSRKYSPADSAETVSCSNGTPEHEAEQSTTTSAVQVAATTSTADPEQKDASANAASSGPSDAITNLNKRRDSDVYTASVISEDFSELNDDSSSLLASGENTPSYLPFYRGGGSRFHQSPITALSTGDPELIGNGGTRKRSKSSIGAFLNKVFAHPSSVPSNCDYQLTVPQSLDFSSAKDSILRLHNGLKHKEVTLAIFDIQNFHSLCETLSAGQISKIHSDYLECISSCVRSHKGAVNVILGDKLLCSWNASTNVLNHSLSAVTAAFACKSHISRINAHYQAAYNYPHITINISVVTGDALVGITGQRQIKNFAIFGQLFYELQHYSKLTKIYNARILINEACYQKVRANFLIRLVDVITICSEKKQVDRCIFEAHSEKNLKTEEWYYSFRRSQQQDKKFYQYNQAWINYMQGNVDEAKKLLDEYEVKCPTDPHASRLRKRIEYKMDSNPLLDVNLRLHDPKLRKSNSHTNILYHSSNTADKEHEKIDLTELLETGDRDL